MSLRWAKYMGVLKLLSTGAALLSNASLTFGGCVLPSIKSLALRPRAGTISKDKGWLSGGLYSFYVISQFDNGTLMDTLRFSKEQQWPHDNAIEWASSTVWVRLRSFRIVRPVLSWQNILSSVLSLFRDQKSAWQRVKVIAGQYKCKSIASNHIAAITV